MERRKFSREFKLKLLGPHLPLAAKGLLRIGRLLAHSFAQHVLMQVQMAGRLRHCNAPLPDQFLTASRSRSCAARSPGSRRSDHFAETSNSPECLVTICSVLRLKQAACQGNEFSLPPGASFAKQRLHLRSCCVEAGAAAVGKVA